MSDAHDDEREATPSLLDVVVFGPIDAAFALARDPRGAASRGRARVDEAMRQARAIGELAVRFGSHELRRRTEAAVGSDEGAGDATVVRASDAGPAPDGVIADYDALSASQIVPMLAGLTAEERAQVAAYETRARGRQTVLRRIAQLDGTGA